MSQTVVLKVGMSCQGCVGAVNRVLGKMEGVESFDIDIKEQKVTIKGNVDPEAVFQTVSKTGKKTSFWEAETPTPATAEPKIKPAEEKPVEEKPEEKPIEPEAKPVEEKPAETVAAVHKLPFVRVWIPCMNLEMDHNGMYVSCTEHVISATNDVYFVADEEMDANDHVYDDYYYDDMLCFRDISKLQPLQKDQGVVGKAFSSGKLCYCQNITEFSIIEYPLVHYARWCGLTTSFAICLKSRDNGYILELFLPPDNGDPRILLGSVLSTMGQHFRNFKVASGQELGNDSSVQVIKASSDKNVDYFHICQTRANQFIPEVLHVEDRRNQLMEGNENQTEKEDRQQLMVQSDVLSIDSHVISEKQCVSVTHSRKESRTRTKDTVNYDDLKQHFDKNVSDAAESLQVSRSTLKRLCRMYGIQRWPLSKRKKSSESDRQPLTVLPKKNRSITSETTTHKDDKSSSSSFTVKATYGDDMMKFKLYTFSRKDDLDNEVSKRLQLPVGRFRINYMDEDNDWIWIACDDDLNDCFNNVQSLGKNTIKMLVLPTAISHHIEL